MWDDGKRIMIVETDREVLSVIYLALLQHDYILEATTNVHEAKLRLERFLPDLVLISSSLPEHHISELCASIKDAFEIPVILLSDPFSFKTLCPLTIKADGILEKPVNTDLLLMKTALLLSA
jgi:DNA-binding response OmpR family regulator